MNDTELSAEELVAALKCNNSMVSRERINGGHWSLNLMWFGIVIAVTVFILCCAFCIYYSYQKQRWEILRLRNLVHVNREKNKIQHPGWNAEPFSGMMSSIRGVQGALLDDVLEEMETEGGDIGNNQLDSDECVIREGIIN